MDGREAALRVMQVLGARGDGGAETFFVTLCLAFQRAGIVQDVVMRAHPARLALLQAAGLEPLTLGFGGPLDLLTRWRIGRRARAWRPDVALTWMNRATRHTPRGAYAKIGRLGGFYDAGYYRGCDHLVANTPGVRDHLLAQGWPAERIAVIPNFTTLAPAEPAARGPLQTPEEAPVLLALGRLHPVKGFDTAIAALGRLPGAYLWIAGEGAERPALEALAAARGVAGRVRLLGWRQDRAALLAAATAVLVPSRSEPFGNVVLEAWAAGRPVIASAVDGPAWLIADGVSGLLVPPGDEAALAAAAARLLADPGLAARLAGGGYRRRAAEFTEEAVVARYRELFRQVTERRQGR